MNYGVHPSIELVNLFRKSPYQGQNPKDAKVIFIGLDANYTSQISSHKFFQKIIEYQKDGVAFWRKYGVHHPFLLEDYPFKRNMDGVPYHRNFSKLRLPSDFASNISFVELLDVPTIGTTNESVFLKLINPNHLRWLDAIVSEGQPRAIILSDSVIRKMIKFEESFKCLRSATNQTGLIKKIGETHIYKFSHFSAYQIHTQIESLRKVIISFASI